MPALKMKTSITVLVALLVLIPLTGQDTSMLKLDMLLDRRILHERSVTAESGEKWFGLYITENGFSLAKTTITVSIPKDRRSYWRIVAKDIPGETLFLIADNEIFREGPVVTSFYGYHGLTPNKDNPQSRLNVLSFEEQMYISSAANSSDSGLNSDSIWELKLLTLRKTGWLLTSRSDHS